MNTELFAKLAEEAVENVKTAFYGMHHNATMILVHVENVDDTDDYEDWLADKIEDAKDDLENELEKYFDVRLDIEQYGRMGATVCPSDWCLYGEYGRGFNTDVLGSDSFLHAGVVDTDVLNEAFEFLNNCITIVEEIEHINNFCKKFVKSIPELWKQKNRGAEANLVLICSGCGATHPAEIALTDYKLDSINQIHALIELPPGWVYRDNLPFCEICK